MYNPCLLAFSFSVLRAFYCLAYLHTFTPPLLVSHISSSVFIVTTDSLSLSLTLFFSVVVNIS